MQIVKWFYFKIRQNFENSIVYKLMTNNEYIYLYIKYFDIFMNNIYVTSTDEQLQKYDLYITIKYTYIDYMSCNFRRYI